MAGSFRILAPGFLGASASLSPGTAGAQMPCGMFDTDGDGCKKEPYDANTSCGQYSDAMVCINGNEDVQCTGEIYRGCFYGQGDADAPTDYCCAGWLPFLSNDNIDHAGCLTIDAPWGGSCTTYNDAPGQCHLYDWYCVPGYDWW